MDKKPGSKKPEDKKPEDKKPEDKKPIDKKPEEKKKDEIKSGAAKVRTFDFTYAAVVKELKPGQEARIWLPYPQNTPFQDVKQVDAEIPGETPPRITQEKEYGNKFLYFTAKANAKGEIPFQVEYRVKRREVLTGGKGTLIPAGESPTLLERYLQPDKLVPTSGKPLDLLKGKKIPKDVFGAAKEFYDTVNGVMKYDKPAGKPWGRGDSVWACDSKYGNCTDFHSVFISMARGNKIPAKFEMGFPIPDKRGEGTVGGYHCWAWFLAGGKNWIPVDISEANRNPALKEYYFGNLTEDRVQFSTGRDITLVPPQKGPALNFLINPYVEVDGAPYPQEKIARKFSYNDVK
ncbi:MAG: transglutaminase family protein [Gemmataceae bacterium]